jgi:hypothetical protein
LRHDTSVGQVRRAEQSSYFAMAFYTTYAILAVWLPHVIAAVITAAWVVWVVIHPLVLRRHLT